MLKDIGCELGQGYLFSRPNDADTIHQLLKQNQAAKYVLEKGPVTKPSAVQTLSGERSTNIRGQ